jgi:metal-sulfur cluster biosynthetic enzyme
MPQTFGNTCEVNDDFLTKSFSFESQVSFRLELTTPACPIKDVVNDTIAIV